MSKGRGRKRESLPVLDGGALGASIFDADERDAENCVEQTKSKADTMNGEDAVALVVSTVHLYVVVAPFLDELDCSVCTHYPC